MSASSDVQLVLTWGTLYLLLELLELFVLLLAVVFDLLLGFRAGVLYSLRTVCPVELVRVVTLEAAQAIEAHLLAYIL